MLGDAEIPRYMRRLEFELGHTYTYRLREAADPHIEAMAKVHPWHRKKQTSGFMINRGYKYPYKFKGNLSNPYTKPGYDFLMGYHFLPLALETLLDLQLLL